MPATYATGAAMSSGHGVASTSTWAKRRPVPETIHATIAIANEMMVNGTASMSAVRTTAARDSSADETSFRICWYCESAASDVVRIIIVVEPLMEPESTFAPTNRVRGTGSPLMVLRSTLAVPESSWPLTGTISPGSTMSTEPSLTSFTGTVSK